MKKTLSTLLLILCYIFVGCDSDVNNTPETTTEPIPEIIETTEIPTTAETQYPTDTIEEPTIESEMLAFIDAFNGTSEIPLAFTEDFTPSDKSSTHYRTEFRLDAFSEAIGKSYAYGDTVVDIVGKQSWLGDITIRVYMDGATIDQCIAIISHASPIMDPDIESTVLQETIDYIIEHKYANGYYYADLGLLLLGNDSNGYELMLKMGND